MFTAVLYKNHIIYLGTDLEKNYELCMAHKGAVGVCCSTIEELVTHYENQCKLHASSEFMSDPLEDLLKRLDNVEIPENLQKFGQRLIEEGEKTTHEIKSLGIKSMKALGEGFIALGDLLKRESKNED